MYRASLLDTQFDHAWRNFYDSLPERTWQNWNMWLEPSLAKFNAVKVPDSIYIYIDFETEEDAVAFILRFS